MGIEFGVKLSLELGTVFCYEIVRIGIGFGVTSNCIKQLLFFICQSVDIQEWFSNFQRSFGNTPHAVHFKRNKQSINIHFTGTSNSVQPVQFAIQMTNKNVPFDLRFRRTG